MHNELTEVDIQKMKEEIEYRTGVLRPQILEEVKFARSHGDLSENAEYHAAKQERSRNEGRIRFLRNMIKTAVVVKAESAEDEIGLFDTVTYWIPEDEEEETVRLVTTMRTDLAKKYISTESPVGAALLGHKVGDRVTVTVNDRVQYDIEIRRFTKGTDDDSLAIRRY